MFFRAWPGNTSIKSRRRRYVQVLGIWPVAMLLGCSAADDTSEVAQSADVISPSESAPATPARAHPGKVQFLQCAACHAVKPDAPAKTGPNLHCIVGQPAGKVAGFRYSAAFEDAARGGMVWDQPTLSQFLENPKALVPRNTMAFAGVANAEKRQKIIDYLESECGADNG